MKDRRRALIPILCGVMSAACGTEPPPAPVYQAVPVERRDIVVSAEAAGVIEPHVTVEVKSKASGEILEVLADSGDRVERGTLLLRIDQRQLRNTLAQAKADLEVARARLANAKAQLRRSEKLFKAQSLSETSYDQSVLDHATAKAEVVRSVAAVENAQIEMDDADVLAPIDGTILRRDVERGQVISSPTRDVAGGTVLLTMAALERVRVRTMVDETDIGKIRAGLAATVSVSAYPNRAFQGSVLKIEPQSQIEQNVTMFPTLVALDNPAGLLKPGMNCEVEIHVARRDAVLAIPNAALRTSEDVASGAEVLGLSPDQVEEALAATRESPSRAEAGEAEDDSAAAPGNPGGFRPGVEYVVFTLTDAAPAARWIRTGLTDLDYTEVLDGLSESDSVLVLPSSGLVRSQQRFQERVRRVTGGGLPGVRKSK
jgi:HlyD family secretion protein